MADNFAYFIKKTEQELSKRKFQGQPPNLYEPLNYIISLGGKRIRPVLAFAANSLFNGDIEKAVPAAISVEVFHNFSLIHDDIMDKAPLRRGKATVHQKWNSDTAILSGDIMLVKAYQILAESEKSHLVQLLEVFSKTAAQVCEGQQMDMNFETLENVNESDYLEMIKLKTSVLLGCSLKMGAITANASKTDCDKIYEIGVNMGMGFQLMDDYLDSFGNPDITGKQAGGDIIEGKKTLLYIKAIEAKKTDFIKTIKDTTLAITEKIEQVKNIFTQTGADVYLKNLSENYFKTSLKILEEINVAEENKETLKNIIKFLQSRKN